MTTTLFRPLFFPGLFLSVALLAGCQGQTGSSGKGEAKLYDVKGKVDERFQQKFLRELAQTPSSNPNAPGPTRPRC